ncbi:UDP-N-acetylglucosamine diphosphorylase/glucosamine-1-phosphate N-acetyltransferase [Betaproteobacteria bacterium SCN2]|jgi:bifunctional UDP-N-acetylglucosamine pyrophosphorylase/glucosamine-1-phosphate N-acetyltransferase|nr:UDP-N-acetylglucosamine diphosphorylase/glucosamine-1-phosphate N-acetyltransferase [Betaproteobacteria bacterium SCN2]
MTPALDIVILAAGKGTRMRSGLPKVLHPLAGRPLVSHVIGAAQEIEASRICVVYGFGGDAVPAALAADKLTFVLQAEQLGTGHAVQQALPHLHKNGVTLVLFGDVPLIRADTLKPLVAAAQSGKLGLLTVVLHDATGYGRIVREHGRVVKIVEHKDATDAEREIREVNTGVLAVPTAKLAEWLGRLRNHNAQGEYYLTDIVAMAVADGVDVLASHPADAWEVLGVNSKAQLAELERIHQRNIARELLDGGVTLIDPARIDVRGELNCGRDVSIDVGCVFEGSVEIGDNVTVGPYCVLKDVRVAAGTQIEAFSHLVGADIGEGSRIGPFSRLRPGARLARDVHVGNFVEVKNSVVREGAKMNHLSYIGDAEVGAKTNIGAGTITCNYDGANKHKTVIGDNAFIGSNSALVAPVNIGNDATIGAGSVIVKDAPAGDLSLSRARQLTVPGWKRPVKKKKEE